MVHSYPFFSVIIPTYERAQQLTVCLRALACQNYPRDRFEVLVVDDGSGTSPKAAVNAFLGQLNVRLLAQLHSGPAAARNYGRDMQRSKIVREADDLCLSKHKTEVLPALRWRPKRSWLSGWRCLRIRRFRTTSDL
jgi:glycosyltransferase involved in cell wall biosynthesis